MKISKTSSLLLAIGIPVILLGSLGTVRSQQVQEQTGLYQELTLARQRLEKFQLEQLSFEKEELEKRLEQNISQLEAASAILHTPTGSISASDILFDIADACNVEVDAVTSSGLVGGGNLEGVACSTLTLTVKATGDIPELLDFIAKLNDDLTTGLVKSVQIRIPATISLYKPSANIQVVIYNCGGD